MAEGINAQSAGTPTATEQEKTFTQTELDAAIKNRLDRERKKYPSEDELSAYRAWKDGQQTEQERQVKRDKELADSKSALTAAQNELEQLKREKYVLSKGLTGDDAEFIVFKASKLVDDKTTFEQAVDQLTEHRSRATFDWMAQVGTGSSIGMTLNERINSELRGR